MRAILHNITLSRHFCHERGVFCRKNIHSYCQSYVDISGRVHEKSCNMPVSVHQKCNVLSIFAEFGYEMPIVAFLMDTNRHIFQLFSWTRPEISVPRNLAELNRFIFENQNANIEQNTIIATMMDEEVIAPLTVPPHPDIAVIDSKKLNPNMLTKVSRKLSIILTLGGILNLLSGYEWLPLRSTDLYSWSPRAKSYRVFRGRAIFLLPHYHFSAIGQNVKDLPGIQVFGDGSDAQDKELMQQVNRYSGTGSTELEGDPDPRFAEMLQKLIASNFTAPVTYQQVKIVVDVDHDSPFSLRDWLLTPNHPLVSAYAYNRFSGGAKKRFGIFLTNTSYSRTYPTSILYWLLLCVPIILLWKTTALFDRPLRPSWIFFKYYASDPFGIICCLLETQADVNPKIPHISFKSSLMLAVFNLVATRIYLGDTSSTTRRTTIIKRVAWCVAMAIQAGTVIIITYSTFIVERRVDLRVTSMTRFILGQLLCANLLTEALLLTSKSSTSTNTDRDILTSGLTKLVISFLMFSGGATKVGEAGLGWLDSRFLAMLSMKGRYGVSGGHPYVLEGIMLYVPGVFRTAGMALVWIMELSSLWSWWHFETYMALWGAFMVGSTLSIGVPFKAQLIGPVLNELAVANDDTATMVVVVVGLVGGLVTALLLWNPASRSEKKD
jgi:hypothetical protein